MTTQEDTNNEVDVRDAEYVRYGDRPLLLRLFEALRFAAEAVRERELPLA